MPQYLSEQDLLLIVPERVATPEVPNEEVSSSKKKEPAAVIGVHIRSEKTQIAFLSAAGHLVRTVGLEAGYSEPTALTKELSALIKQVGPKLPVHFSLTGQPVRFSMIKSASLPRATMLKAFRHKLRPEDPDCRDEIQFTALTPESGSEEESGQNYLVGSLEKNLMETIVRPLKRKGIRMMSWDLSINAIARATNFIWKKKGIIRAGEKNQTRLTIVLDWDCSYLILQGEQGQYVTPRMTFGIQTFLEHLLSYRNDAMTEALARIEGDEELISLKARKQKLLKNQAIHEVYVPLVQLIRTQLYAACSENNIPLPKQFMVVSNGSDLFHLPKSLASDLGLDYLDASPYFPEDAAAAVGAGLHAFGSVPTINFLPKGSRLWLKQARQFLRNRLRFDRQSSKKKMGRLVPEANLGTFSVGVVAVLFLASIPVGQRMMAEKQLAVAKNKLSLLSETQALIQKSQDREAQYDRALSMVKAIEKRKRSVTQAVKEIIATIPSEIKLQTLSLKDKTFTLKGVAKDTDSIQSFLRSSLNLSSVQEPTPIGIKREKEQLSFEITFKFRG